MTSSPAPVRTSAAPAPGAASVGVLSRTGNLKGHGCTAAVVASTSGEVIVTAAHCVSGTGAGMLFAPGYRAGTAPYGTWVVQGAYVSPGWLHGEDPEDDVAFLAVRPASSNESTAAVQAVVGGYSLASAPGTGDRVQVRGYVVGTDKAVSCTAKVYLTGRYPTFDCAGFASGTSGGPWISRTATGRAAIAAVIGGPHHGGCSADTSYSAAFTDATAGLLTRAEDDQSADVVPAAQSPGC